MLIVCPTCATSYMVDQAALGPAGRTVRCARCKSAWFAGGPKAKPDAIAGFVDDVIAEAQARDNSQASTGRADVPPVAPADDFGEEAHQPIGHPLPEEQHDQDSASTRPSEDRGNSAAEIPAEIADAPSLVPPVDDALPREPRDAAQFSTDSGESFMARRARMQQSRKQKRRSSKWTALVLVLVGFNVTVIGARHEVVRYLPQTASLFAAVGLPVNLRGLSFVDVKVGREEAEGVSVLVVEGNIVSSSNKPVEVPRIRFAVRNSTGQEIYAWTALPARSILAPQETLPFKSRLASPPADATDVLVRFFSAQDGAAPKLLAKPESKPAEPKSGEPK
jgi:predicted Zn finger-like uncharacterized protein